MFIFKYFLVVWIYFSKILGRVRRGFDQGLLIFFFHMGLLSRTFTIHRTAGEGEGYLFNSTLPLLLVSQTLRHQSRDYCRKPISTHSQQADSNQELLVSEPKSLILNLYFSYRAQYPIVFSSIISLSMKECCSLLEIEMFQTFNSFGAFPQYLGQFRASLMLIMIGQARIFIFAFVSALLWFYMSSKPFKSGNIMKTEYLN